MQTLFVPCTEASPSVAIKTPKVCKFSVGIRAGTSVQKSGGAITVAPFLLHFLIPAVATQDCCRPPPLGTSMGAPSAVAQCPSWSLGPCAPGVHCPGSPGLQVGAGWAGCVPGSAASLLCLGVFPSLCGWDSSLGMHVTPAPCAWTISLLA